MARKLFKRIAPSPEFIKAHPALQRFAHWLHDPNLWHLNRYSVSMAAFIGLFTAFIPLPSQMPIAALWAIWWRANFPISVALVWLTNPITAPPAFYATYKFGNLLLQRTPPPLQFEPSLAWFVEQLSQIWQPLLLGSACVGFFFGALGAMTVRIVWRIQVTLRWRARRRARAHKP
ncbi:MAG TPA: DUF2062 domain-containing protein [Spongiibacteraceae bacterium]|nr:DUF2062 domain-containing protein [Spongiibacteraceae bacterium]